MLTTLMIRNGEHREHQQDKWEEYDGFGERDHRPGGVGLGDVGNYRPARVARDCWYILSFSSPSSACRATSASATVISLRASR